MEEKEIILDAMRKAGEPLNAGKVAELTGLDRKVVDKAFAAMKKEGTIVSPVRCKWDLPKNNRNRMFQQLYYKGRRAESFVSLSFFVYPRPNREANFSYESKLEWEVLRNSETSDNNKRIRCLSLQKFLLIIVQSDINLFRILQKYTD